MRGDGSQVQPPGRFVGSRQSNYGMPRPLQRVCDGASDVACGSSEEDDHNELRPFLYSEAFLDHFKNPRNVGELGSPAVTVQIENPVCGDILRLSARFEDGRVAEVRYKVRGCTAAIASGSALTDWMQGKTRAELTALSKDMIEAAVGGLIPESKHAAVLCLDGVKKLLSDSR